MTLAYHEAKNIIKKHVNASKDVGTGMTGAINKFQRILGLKLNENLKDYIKVPEEKRPIIFVSHMEHHSNHTSWLETIARVKVIPSNKRGLPCLDSLAVLLSEFKNIPIKIAAITACSDVTGIRINYHKIAKIMHENNGLCFVDFACSAPCAKINMHPEEGKSEYLDAIQDVSKNYKQLSKDYKYDALKNEFIHKNNQNIEKKLSKISLNNIL
ncbi:aminotransferase class V [Tenacibaculum adriaticum]|uniref:Aminotransferase class V n=1 Tax=Tenacibaculum adriaticum TaxID=413713 RepID=A0A5S5DR01_9FLAO|nr:aminotransferase class V [Tenacibaculum adriaticum]